MMILISVALIYAVASALDALRRERERASDRKIYRAERAVADALRAVSSLRERLFDEGERSRQIEHDLRSALRDDLVPQSLTVLECSLETTRERIKLLQESIEQGESDVRKLKLELSDTLAQHPRLARRLGCHLYNRAILNDRECGIFY